METWQIALLAFYFVVWAIGMTLQTLLVRRLKAKSDAELERHLGPGARARLLGYSPASSLIVLRLLFTNTPLSRSPDLRTICPWLRGCVILIAVSLAAFPFLMFRH